MWLLQGKWNIPREARQRREVFLGGDAAVFDVKSCSNRIEAHANSVCIEMVFWRFLDHIAEEQNTQLSQFVSRPLQ